DAASEVAQSDEGREPLAGHGTVRAQSRAAVDDGHQLPADDLADDPVVIDEEASLPDVAMRRRPGKNGFRSLPIRSRWRRSERREATDGFPELLDQVAVARDAVALAVECVLAGPGAEDH